MPDVPAYTNYDIQLQNFTPDDGLKSPKHVEHLMINKDTLKEFVHLVGLLIYILQYDVRCIQRQIETVFKTLIRNSVSRRHILD